MKRTYLATLAVIFILSSCSKTFYQVYNTEIPDMMEIENSLVYPGAPDMMENENSLVYRNGDCKLVYNLWSENGNLSFIMYNETDEDLFVILSYSFFIKNGMAFDYYQNREFHQTENSVASSKVSSDISPNGITDTSGAWHSLKPTNLVKANSRGISTTCVRKEDPIICIPAHSFKLISEFSISSELIRDCDNKQFYPKKKSATITFTKEDTPLLFINKIAYSRQKGEYELEFIENEFWVSELTNYSRKSAASKESVKNCKKDTGVMRYVFKMASPKKFYNSYKRGH